MTDSPNFYNKVINYCLFFSLFFLLCTKNFTVAIVGILLLTSIVYIVKNHKKIKVSSFDKLVIIIFSAYFIASIPIYVRDMETTRYFKGSVRYLCFIPIYFFIKNEIISPQESRKYLESGIILGSIGTLAIALYEHFFLGMSRVNGFLFSINFGYLSCSLAFLSLSLRKDSYYKKLLFISFIIDIYSTTLTLTRGAIFAIPILIIMTAFFYRKENQLKRIISYFIIGIILFYSLCQLSPHFKTRIEFTSHELSSIYKGDLEQSSSWTRLSLWYASIKSFSENPLTGQTYKERENKLKELYSERKVTIEAATKKRAHAHNQYFEMLASYGVLGIFSFILLLFVPLFFFLKRIYQTNYALTGFIFVSGFILFCMTEVPLEQNLISTYYGLILVILIVLTNLDIKILISKETV